MIKFKSEKKLHTFTLYFILLFCLIISFPNRAQNGTWITGDFHMHTTMSDGDNTPAELAEHAFGKYNLGVIAITDHGGHFFRVNENFLRTDNKGNVFLIRNYDSLMATDAKRFKNFSRTIQILQRSLPEVLRLRKKYPNKLIIQGLEWNIPGHDHGSVGILSNTGTEIRDFCYLFDRNDTLASWKTNLIKHNKNIHKNALVALDYLKTKYPDRSYFIVNHPSRKLEYTISDFRDFNNEAPQIAIGFEGLPGHQKNPGDRCKYDKNLGDCINYHSKTYGGADFMLAKIGGVWDALLGEGRQFWVFTNSDFHRATQDFWPGEYAKDYIWVEKKDYKSLIQGLRSGKIFAVMGDLICDLNFTANTNGKVASMGESLEVKKGSTILLKIGFESPSINSNGDVPKVDHIDLICGDITGKIPPDSKDYNKPVNLFTKIIKRFSKKDWKKGNDGLNYMIYSFKALKPQYFRLRGTDVPINTKNETDKNGNPLCDVLAGKNSEKEAWKDLWFYSNPVFIRIIN